MDKAGGARRLPSHKPRGCVLYEAIKILHSTQKKYGNCLSRKDKCVSLHQKQEQQLLKHTHHENEEHHQERDYQHPAHA